MCFKRVLELEGGRPRAATLYCSKCLKMGKPWILYNTMTERVDFLYIEKSQVELMETAWGSFLTEGSEAGPEKAKPTKKPK
eukprot:4330330-Alexandrium_andersonii.AAC.1